MIRGIKILLEKVRINRNVEKVFKLESWRVL